MKQATILLLCACALAPALAAGIPALAQTSQATTETTQATTGGIGSAAVPQAEAASAREQRARGREQLRSIAACESHGDPRAVGGGGTYRGMYQFSFGTWQIVGGAGDPAAASRHEQTWRAWLLLSRHGAGHWPACG